MFKKDSPAKTESHDSTPAAGGSGDVSPRQKRNNLEVLEMQVEHFKKENAELRNQLAQTGCTKSPPTIMQSQQPYLAAMENAMSSIMTALHNFFHFEIEEPELKEAMEVAQSYLRASEMAMKSHHHTENRILSDISGGSTTLPSLQSNSKHREVTAMAGGMGGAFSSNTASTHLGGGGSTTTDDQPPSYHKGDSRGTALGRTARPSSPISFRIRKHGGHAHTSHMILRGQTEEIDDEVQLELCNYINTGKYRFLIVLVCRRTSKSYDMSYTKSN